MSQEGSNTEKKPEVADGSAHINIKVTNQLEMEDRDEIDAMLPQLGGGTVA